MLTTFARIIQEARTIRHRESTYDGRDPYDLIRELQAQVDVLKARIQELSQ